MNLRSLLLAVVASLSVMPAHAAFHLFRIDQIYSNADGSVQFLMLQSARYESGRFVPLQLTGETLMVDEKVLKRLRSRRPRQPHYLERGKKEPSRLVASWNLVVPERVLARAWEESA